MNIAEIEELNVQQMPNSPEVERDVIGSIINNEYQSADAITELTIDDFYTSKYRMMFDVCTTIVKRDGGISLTTVINELRQMDMLGKKIDAEEVCEMCGKVLAQSEASYLRGVLREKRIHRDLIKCLLMSLHNSQAACADVNSLINNVMTNIENLSIITETVHAEQVSLVAERYVDYIYAIQKGDVKSGIDMGYSGLVRMTGLLQGGDLIILAGRTSHGKTQFAINIAKKVASSKIPVAIYSIEMQKEHIASRMVTMDTGISKAEMESVGKLSEPQIQVLSRSVRRLSLPIYIDDTSSLNISQLRAKSKRLIRTQKVQLIIVDYLQLTTSDTKFATREQEVAYISRSLKAIAKELNVPVIALSQLSRNAVLTGAPKLSDLRESGSIEQDADIVLFVNQHKESELDDGCIPTEIIVAKNRNGVTGTAEMIYNPSKLTFRERVSAEDFTPNRPTYTPEDLVL